MKIWNKEYKTVTLELLKKLEACDDGLDFFLRNKLEGFPLNRLHEIEGDYNCFVSWLKRTLDETKWWEFDQNGNKVKEAYPYGDVWKYEYDASGNMTKQVDWKGRPTEYEYDQSGNMTKKVYFDGRVLEYEYDQNGNQTREVDCFGCVKKFEHDKNGNKSKIVFFNHHIERKSSFYPDGQLESYCDLKIPFFEKPLDM